MSYDSCNPLRSDRRRWEVDALDGRCVLCASLTTAGVGLAAFPVDFGLPFW
jgi:hypothetical protein